VLREVKNATWARRLTLLGWRHELSLGSRALAGTWSTRTLGRLGAEQRELPVCLVEQDGRAYWWFEDALYWVDEQLAAEDVLALVRERQRRRLRRLERAHAALALEGDPANRRREPIPRDVRQAVFERDGGRCVQCGATFELQYDHVIPHSLGGASTVENLQLLCAPCNQRKGGSL
jgi:hypothetical protein